MMKREEAENGHVLGAILCPSNKFYLDGYTILGLDLINAIGHMHLSGIETLSVILSQTQHHLNLKCNPPPPKKK